MQLEVALCIGICQILIAKNDLEKALAISNNPYINYAYAEYLFDYSYVLIDKDKQIWQ